mmetsp:Transcript_33697/g.95338  ORF Transcript_33697/g.95338 Transcript_33697/m.95338 type:complete len:245 (+) Transcript_33697:2459-3193(+)
MHAWDHRVHGGRGRSWGAGRLPARRPAAHCPGLDHSGLNDPCHTAILEVCRSHGTCHLLLGRCGGGVGGGESPLLLLLLLQLCWARARRVPTPGLAQHLHNVDVLIVIPEQLNRETARVVLFARIGPMLQEHRGSSGAALPGSKVEGGAAVDGSAVHAGTLLEEQLAHLGQVVGRGPVQRRRHVLALGVHLRAAHFKHLPNLGDVPLDHLVQQQLIGPDNLRHRAGSRRLRLIVCHVRSLQVCR